MWENIWVDFVYIEFLRVDVKILIKVFINFFDIIWEKDIILDDGI